MKSIETKEKFVEMRAKGLSYALIGRKLKTAKSTLINWNEELGSEISMLKDERVEAIRTKYKLNQVAELERYGGWLKKIEKELRSRDFRDVKTDRLLDMAMKVSSVLEDRRGSDDNDRDSNVVTVDELEQMARGDYQVVN